MSENAPTRSEPLPLPDNFTSIQPGGGRCYRLELAWGCWRRWWLVHFRPGYVRLMAGRRKGDPTGAPYEILDPRDLKFFRNRCNCDWNPADDPFQYRCRLGFARWGLAELLLMGGPLLIATIVLAWFFWYLAPVTGALFCLIVYFFRDPRRHIPTEPGLLVAPADGKVVEITKLAHDEFIGGPAVRIGVFLSIFNVHLNRAPAASRVIALRYSPGGFLSATRPECAERNENTWIGLEEDSPPHRRMVVRQISGMIARRIVCDLRPGESLERGQKIGMIKLGSRTELILPDLPGLKIELQLGQKIRAGETIVARW
jgi:phosphatidylserine decarboxylase